MRDKRAAALWIVLGLAVVLGLLWQFVKLPDADLRIHQLPMQGVGFTGYDLPLSEDELKFFANVNMVKRVYQVGDQRYFIYVLDGTHNRHAVHDPTYCFRGSGWEVVSQKPFPVEGGMGALYQLVKGKERKDALLWFSDGKERFASPFEYWWKTTLRRLTLGRSGPEPVLIVIQPLKATEDTNWNKLLQQFPELSKI
jgi:hypothetical protein